MKFLRGVSADRLIRALEQIGYSVARQKGSHVRLRHAGPPPHALTVPLHRALKADASVRGVALPRINVAPLRTAPARGKPILI